MKICKRRLVYFNHDRKFKAFQEMETDLKNKQNEFPSNFIKTSRYTMMSFFPMSLLLQFKRYANIYFLVTAVLQTIPSISPLSPYVAVAPLIFVLAVSMTREGYEDFQRHASDKEQNYLTKTNRVLSDRTEENIPWADIQVGDILHIQQDECFPADLIVLGSDLEGMCYIETGALDGEKNLKPKSALNSTADFFSTRIDDTAILTTSHRFTNIKTNIHLFISAKSPDQDPNSFVGSIGFISSDSMKDQKIQQIPADQNQFVPRGAFLRNTDSIYAVVVYTGMDTKIMRNAEEPKPKSSNMEARMNQFILCILIFQLFCAMIMSSCAFYWLEQQEGLLPYLNLKINNRSNSLQSAMVYFSYFILFNTMIPISLIVSLEMVKLLQSYFIANDAEMYSAHNDRWPRVLTSTINEELGQVEYIFSDKTGTLTQNQMQFKLAVIGNTVYGQNTANKKRNEKIPHARSKQQKQHAHTEFVFQDENLTKLLEETNENLENPSLDIILKSQDGKASFNIDTQLELAKEYFSLLGLTHECIVEKRKDPNDKTMQYQGPSPDEITLVDAAYHMGFTFIGKTSNKLQMKVRSKNGSEDNKEVTRINVFEFSSARKRNTILIEDNEVYKMYVKGADNVIKERLDSSIEQPFLQNADKKLTQFSVVGLRTLLIGMKVMSKSEVDSFIVKYNNLSHSTQRKEDLADEVERGFFLLGATAVEDKLQDDVPETINDLLRATTVKLSLADIKVWMLTGDKLETAENIAKSCKLILEDFELLVMSDKNPKVIRREIMDVLWRRFKKLKESKIRKCFLVEGDCLKVIFAKENQDIKKKFIQITKECESVVCCRVSPVQKAEVVRAIREGLNKITLAIGDGANDVNMIQAAHIGCGIYGNEGMRAVQSSDFAFGQFKCLWRLIFVHGRWSYIRISEMIIYFFYKNMQFDLSEANYIIRFVKNRIFTIPQLFFAFYSGFSAQSIFDDFYISLYNLIFTALPLIIRAVFDQDVNHNYVSIDLKESQNLGPKDQIRMSRLISSRRKYIRERLPSLYYIGQQQQLFSTSIFLEWIIQGFVHGLIIFYITFWSIGDLIFDKNGRTSDQWSFSLIIFTAIIFVVDIKLGIHTRFWTAINYIAFYGTSIGLYIVAFFVTGFLSQSQVFVTPIYLVSTPHFYLVIFLLVAGIFAFDAALFSAKELFVNKTKEKALRKLLKQQPKKCQEKNKWVFEGSMIEMESNLHSFADRVFGDESIIRFDSVVSKNDLEQYDISQKNQEQLKKEADAIFLNVKDPYGKLIQLTQTQENYDDNILPIQTNTFRGNEQSFLQPQDPLYSIKSPAQNTVLQNQISSDNHHTDYYLDTEENEDTIYKQRLKLNQIPFILTPNTLQKDTKQTEPTNYLEDVHLDINQIEKQ